MPMELLAEWTDKDPLKRLEQALRERAGDRRASGWRASASGSATRCKEAVERADDDELRARCRGSPPGAFSRETTSVPELTYLEAIRQAPARRDGDRRARLRAWARTSAARAARSAPPRSCSSGSASCGRSTRRWPSRASSAWPSARPWRASGRWPRCSSPTSCPAPSTSWSPAPPRCTTGSAGRCRMVVRCPNGGGVGGGPYHSENVEAWFHHHAGLKIVCPATATDAYGLLRVGDPRPQPGRVLRAQVPLPAGQGGGRHRRLRAASWCRSARPGSRGRATI